MKFCDQSFYLQILAARISRFKSCIKNHHLRQKQQWSKAGKGEVFPYPQSAPQNHLPFFQGICQVNPPKAKKTTHLWMSMVVIKRLWINYKLIKGLWKKSKIPQTKFFSSQRLCVELRNAHHRAGWHDMFFTFLGLGIPKRNLYHGNLQEIRPYEGIS